jgi:dihydroxyacetone kinase DhaKLM complex PTS-EIIA-like component DhaM
MIGILVVSHSEDAARGIVDIASGMVGESGDVLLVGVGGNEEGGLGVSVMKVADALNGMLPKCDGGILIIADLGSSILASRGALDLVDSEYSSLRIAIADAPVLEGTMMAAVEASSGSDLETVAESAREAKNLNKSEH